MYYSYSVIKLREPQVRSHKFHCQNHVLWTVLLHLCYLNKKIFLLGQVGRKTLSLPPQSGAYAHKTLFHFQVISNCSSSQAHSRIPRSAGQVLLHFLLGLETRGKGCLLAGSSDGSRGCSAGSLPLCPARTGVLTWDLPGPSLGPASLPGSTNRIIDWE